MAYTAHVERQQRPRRDAVPVSVLLVFLNLVRAIALEYRIRRETRQVLAMSDQMLRDVGLARSQVRHAVRFGRLE